uniref:Ig-like domain-containing protein n=1 Tax=Electrophorus electricus TaxID=8005 RepID=A0A4W4E3Z4_ELEEL
VTCLYQSDIDMHFSWYKHAFSQKPELINNAQVSDSATYYCGNAQSNIVKFGKATKSIVKGNFCLCYLSVLQQPVLEPVHPGNFVTLQCTVLTENYSCSGEHSVYWFRHGSNKSRPEIIYTHGNRSDQCKTDSDAGSPTWTCVYDLPRSYTRHSGGGTYYCAVAACGEILFGNGTKVDVSISRLLPGILLIVLFFHKGASNYNQSHLNQVTE